MSQINRILEVLSDYQPHSNWELVARAYRNDGPSVANLSGRLSDIRKQGYNINGWKDKNDSRKFWYQLISKPNIQPEYKVETNGQMVFV